MKGDKVQRRVPRSHWEVKEVKRWRPLPCRNETWPFPGRTYLGYKDINVFECSHSYFLHFLWLIHLVICGLYCGDSDIIDNCMKPFFAFCYSPAH